MSTPGIAFEPNVSRRMSSDWNRRARSDARYYVALGRRDQSWEDFFSGAEDLVLGLEKELDRIAAPTAPTGRCALEIGCGPGRLMLPLSRHFRQIHGVDVSDGMVRLARRNLASVPHAYVHTADGTSLTQFGDEFFDFVYSYAVFQHIPSREVVLNYLKETRRVLRTGGVARLQFNGLKEESGKYDTWSGVRFRSREISEFAREHDLQLLALEGAGTQYMWATFVKRETGWFESQARIVENPDCSIRRITAAENSEPSIPIRGRYAAFALTVRSLPFDADLNTLRIEVSGREATITYISPLQKAGLQQVTSFLPVGLASGLHPIRLFLANRPLGSETFLRAVAPGPEVPRIVRVTDAVCVGAGRVVSSGSFRIALEETQSPDQLTATVDSRLATRASTVCSVPHLPRFEIDFKLPAGISTGTHILECRHGKRFLGSWELVVDRDRFWWLRRMQPAEMYQSLLRLVRERMR
jgi:ubiquinone/menaquinone biosynthesis C-methylase UbiE